VRRLPCSKPLVSLVFSFLLLSLPAFQMSAVAKGKKDILKKKKSSIGEIKKKLSEKEKLIKKLKSRETSILSVIEDLDVEIDKDSKKLGELKKDKSGVAGEISGLNSEIKVLRREVGSQESEIRERLKSSYKMGEYGFLKILLSSKDYSDFQRKRYYLKTLIENEASMLDSYIASEKKLSSKLDLLKDKNERLKKLSDGVEASLSGVRENRGKRVAILRTVRSEKELEIKRAKELAKAAKNLEKMIKKIKAKYSGGGANFAMYKGELSKPVRGVMARGYGQYVNTRLNIKMSSKGMEIKVDSASPVNSVFDGKIIYAGIFRGYGRMVIVDHGENYYSLYARLNSIVKNLGDRIKRGEKIGTAGGESAPGTPNLYFEIRHNGIPVNPEPWFAR